MSVKHVPQSKTYLQAKHIEYVLNAWCKPACFLGPGHPARHATSKANLNKERDLDIFVADNIFKGTTNGAPGLTT